ADPLPEEPRDRDAEQPEERHGGEEEEPPAERRRVLQRLGDGVGDRRKRRRPEDQLRASINRVVERRHFGFRGQMGPRERRRYLSFGANLSQGREGGLVPGLSVGLPVGAVLGVGGNFLKRRAMIFSTFG